MLGLNKNGNDLKYAIANFLIILAASIVMELILKLPSGDFPSKFEVYECCLRGLGVALGSSGIIAGINRVTKKD